MTVKKEEIIVSFSETQLLEGERVCFRVIRNLKKPASIPAKCHSLQAVLERTKEELRRVLDINVEIIRGGLLQDSAKTKVFNCLKKQNVIRMASLSQETLDSEIQPRIRIQGKVIFSQAMCVCAHIRAYARERRRQREKEMTFV